MLRGGGPSKTSLLPIAPRPRLRRATIGHCSPPSRRSSRGVGWRLSAGSRPPRRRRPERRVPSS
eukprot:11917338-Alexandrium_andersonii.AAC.1